MKLLGVPFLLVLFIVTFIDATIHNGYFVMTGGFLANVGIKPEHIMLVMSHRPGRRDPDHGRSSAGCWPGSAGGRR